MLVNDWSLRNLIPGELAKGFGFYQSKPATAFSPVAVTPDELGDGVARQQGAPAARQPHQRPGVRPARRRHRHDLQLRAAHRARDAGRAGSAPAPSSARARCRTTTAAAARAASPKSARSSRSSTARRARRSCSSATACPSRCSTRDGRSIFGALDNQVVQASVSLASDNSDFDQPRASARAPGPRVRYRPGSRARRR